MTRAQEALFAKAHRALRAAYASIDRNDAETGINAAFYAAQAALLEQGEAPKTHSGVLTRFHLHFVKDGPLSIEEAKRFRHAFDMRLNADYDAFATFETQAAADLARDAERFVAAVEEMVAT